jgi:hypothetical protein
MNEPVLNQWHLWFILVAGFIFLMSLCGALRYWITTWARVEEIDIETHHEQVVAEIDKAPRVNFMMGGGDGFDEEYEQNTATRH